MSDNESTSVLSAHINVGFSGHFTLVKRKAKDESRVEVLEFDNLITDSGLNQRGKGPTINKCQVGSGTNPPAITDTALQTLVATSTSSQIVTAPYSEFSYSAANRSQSYTCCYRFAGVNLGTLAAIAMGWTDAPAGIWCRSLIKDENGNPTTITLFEDEILDVYYTITLQFPLTDVTGTFELRGTTYTWVGRPASLSTKATNWYNLFQTPLCGEPHPTPASGNAGPLMVGYSGPIEVVTTYPNGQLGANYYVQSDTYVNGSFSRTITNIFPPDYCNGTIQSFRMYVWPNNSSPCFEWQFGISPSIVKTNISEMTSVTVVSWNRA